MISNEILDTEFIDEEYQKDDSFDLYDNSDFSDNETVTETDSDKRKLFLSRFTNDEGKYRFFHNECGSYEFARTPITFRLYNDNTDYKGIVMKEMDKTHFIFMLENVSENSSTKKMKKIDISDISVYF